MKNTGSSIVLSKSELQRIKASAIITTPAMIEKEKAAREAKQAIVRKKQQDRKQQMLRKSAEAAKNKAKSDIELLKEAETEAIRANAAKQRDSELDAFKLLQTLGARAVAFEVREMQLKEKEEREAKAKLYEEKFFLKMELDRYEDLNRREAKEKEVHQWKIDNQKVLDKQIAAREKERMQRHREREFEGLERKAQIERYKQEDQQKQEEDKVKRAQAIQRVAETNRQALLMKEAQKREEVAADEKIFQYQIERARLEAEREAQKEEEAKQKELMTMRLVAAQTKTADTRSQLDELRAKRAFEQKERMAREAAERKRVKQIEDMALLQRERDKAIATKQLDRIFMIKEQEAEYYKIQADNDVIREKEKREEGRLKEARLENNRFVQQQIREKEEKRAIQRQKKYLEGGEIKKSFQEERSKLENIRKEQVNKLLQQGVNKKYLSEMKGLDMGKIQNV